MQKPELCVLSIVGEIIQFDLINRKCQIVSNIILIVAMTD